MSHDYHLRCARCREGSEEVAGGDRARDLLAAAVRTSYGLHLAQKQGWTFHDVLEVGGQYLPAVVVRFVLAHWGHGGFQVVSEYWREGDPEREAKYPPLFVTPEVPAGTLYEAACLPSLVDDAKRVRDELAELLVRIDRAQDAALSEART